MTAPDSPERPTLDLDALRARADRRKSDRDVSPDVENLIDDLLDATDVLVAAVRDRDARIAALEAEVARLRAWSLTLVSEVNAASRTADAARAQVAAVLALCDETEANYVRVFQTPEQVAAFGPSMPVVQVDVRHIRAAVAAASPTPTRPGDDEVTRP